MKSRAGPRGTMADSAPRLRQPVHQAPAGRWEGRAVLTGILSGAVSLAASNAEPVQGRPAIHPGPESASQGPDVDATAVGQVRAGSRQA